MAGERHRNTSLVKCSWIVNTVGGPPMLPVSRAESQRRVWAAFEQIIEAESGFVPASRQQPLGCEIVLLEALGELVRGAA